MRSFTVAQQHAGCLRIVLVSFATVIVMLIGFVEIQILLPQGPQAPIALWYGLVWSYGRILVSLAIAAAAGFFLCWGLLLGFTRSRQDLRWLSLYFGILGAIVVAVFATALVLLSDSYVPAWQRYLGVLIATVAGFLLCWGWARLMSWVIGRFRNAQSLQ